MNGLNILPSYTDYFHLNTTTFALNTAAVWIGSFLPGFTYQKVPDLIGRKWSLFFASIIIIIGVIIQTAAQNVGMFVVSRIIGGYGSGAAAIAGPVYLAETLPPKWRAMGLGFFYTFYYVGKSSSQRLQHAELPFYALTTRLTFV